MTLKPMYPAAVNSPGTELAADITATATEIAVLSTNGLPSAPNLLTLGSDETAETVRYTKIDGTKLTIERGFQGVAKSWSAGTRVARYFTAYDHDTFRENIEAIDADISSAERADLTFTPGSQIVEVENDTPFQMGEVKGRTEIHEGDGIINVKNPYAIVTGGNLLPPFYEWNGGTSGIFLEPYTQKVVSTGDRMNSATQMPAVEGKTYTLRIEREGDGEIGLDFRDDHNNVLWTSEFVKQDNIIATAPQGTAYMNAWTSAPAAGEFIFRNPMLTVGTEPKAFVPQQRSMLAFETELAAHPVDGSNPDTLFVGDDGLPYVLENWGKEVLAENQQWGLVATYTGFKQVGGQTYRYPITGHQGLVVKYDGKLLPNFAGIPSSADMGTISQNSGELHITIANTDSGWGPDYEPTPDEIKAYFLGWKMYDRATNPAGDGVYNRTDGVNKEWAYRNPDGGYSGGIATLPTSVSPKILDGTHDFYRLQYLKAKPTVEPVRNYELGATLSAGSNMVEVGSGIVIREKANPVFYSADNTYHINWTGNNASILDHRTDKILEIFQSSSKDPTWNIVKDNSAYGNERAYIVAANYDPTAIYHVTYTILDPTLAAPINGNVAANLRGTVSDLVKDVGDIGRRLSVVETQKAEKDNAVIWIKPSLLNGWTHYPEPYAGCAYSLNAGVVTIRGFVKPGTQSAGTHLFMLPKGLRPKEQLLFSQLTSAGPTNPSPITIEITPSGLVYIGTTALDAWTNLTGISFLAEQ